MPKTARNPTKGLSKILPRIGCSDKDRQKSKQMRSSCSGIDEGFATFAVAIPIRLSKSAV